MAALLPRYQRPLSVGAVVSDAVDIFRRRWPTLVTIMLATIVPYFVLFVAGAALGLAAVLAIGTNGLEQTLRSPTTLISLGLGGFVLLVLFVVFQLAAEVAVIRVALAAMRGEQLGVRAALGGGLPRLGSMLGAALLIFIYVLLLALVSLPLLVLSLLGLLTLVALVVWAANPGARRPWLKWFIILTVPFGLVMYYGTRWALYGPAIVGEHVSAAASLRRSAELIRGRWWWTFGALLAVGVITSILQAIPGAILGAIVAIALGASGAGSNANVAGQVVQQAVNLVGWILFGSLAYVGATVLFVYLRNAGAEAAWSGATDALD